MDAQEHTKRPRSTSTSDSQPPGNRQKVATPSASDCDNSTILTDPHQSSTRQSSTHQSSINQYSSSLSSNFFGRPIRAEQWIPGDKILRMEQETRGHWIGPMNPVLFLEMFLPSANNTLVRPVFKTDAFLALLNSDKSNICEGLMESLSPFIPGLVSLVNTPSAKDTPENGATISIYPDPLPIDTEADVATRIGPSQTEIPIFVKSQDFEDPFSDVGQRYDESTETNRFPFECKENSSHRSTRGQIGLCLASLSGAQFRLHAFAILICGKWTRMLRWDRSGVVVTKRFSFAVDDYLTEFFWRYSHTPLNDPARGHDPTVQTMSPNHISTPEEAEARTKLAEANSDTHREFRVIMIPDRDTDTEYPFLVSYPPRFDYYSPFGRATRGMLAFDLAKNMMVFIKDYWRTVSDSAEKEGDIYKILHNANVPYIPPFGRGNDVRDHVSLSNVIKGEKWAHPTAKLGSLRHYRMSLEKIGRPSNTFKSSHELVSTVADAIEAHDVAFHDANILHRDISASNVLITEDGRGMLIDWDLCLNLNNPRNKGKNERTGTWEFLSGMLLREPNHKQGVLDDKESFLYVILWNMMVYTPYNTSFRHSEEMELFEENERGVTKLLFLLSHHSQLKFDGRPRLNALIRELSQTFKVRYDAQDEISPKDRESWLSEERLASYPNNPLALKMCLMDRFWLLRTVRKHLEPRAEWPAADKPCKNADTRSQNRRTAFFR